MITFTALSAKALRVFARDVIPNTFLYKITNHDGLRRFIDQWQSSNRVRHFHISIFLLTVTGVHRTLFGKEYRIDVLSGVLSYLFLD